MKIQYRDIERIAQEMLGYVATMETKLNGFKRTTEGFAEKIQDNISQRAVTLVEEISTYVKELRESIEKGVTIVGDAMSTLDNDEDVISGEISGL